MTGPVRVGEVLPGVLAEVIERAGHGYDRWAELVAQAGYCHHPIRLAGRVEHADRTTGEVRQVYDSEREPDGVLLKACGTRREARCPSCAATYRAAVRHLHRPQLRPRPHPQSPRAPGAALSPAPPRCPLSAWSAGWLLAPPRRG